MQPGADDFTQVKWRGAHTVIVTDAHAMGSVGVIRSLGLAGYRVIATSHVTNAIGLKSNFAARSLHGPAPSRTGSTYAEWLAKVVRDESASVIVPSEGVLLAIRSRFDEFFHLIPFSRTTDIVYTGMSKCQTFLAFQRAGLLERLPPLMIIRDDGALPSLDELQKLGLPCFVKADASLAVGSEESIVVRCESALDAAATLEKLRPLYRMLLVQGYVPGTGVGAFILRWNGRVIARFMHRRIHEVPHTGGASSFRESWWHAKIMADAERRSEALRWEGVAMFEYRWHPETDHFYLIELNGRFWGSIHLALFAGADFPRLLVDAFLGHESRSTRFDMHARTRWTFPREVEYVRSRLKDSQLSLGSRFWSMIEFLLLGLDPRVKSDLNFPGDRKLYWIGMRQAFGRWFGKN